MRVARIVINTRLLLDALAFPDGAKVKACIGERAPLGEIELFVEHEYLPDVPDGQPIPRRDPIIKAEYLPATFYTFDWGEEVVEPNETAVLNRFYDDVCREAETRMKITGRLEGAHYAAMRSLLAEKGIRV